MILLFLHFCSVVRMKALFFFIDLCPPPESGRSRSVRLAIDEDGKGQGREQSRATVKGNLDFGPRDSNPLRGKEPSNCYYTLSNCPFLDISEDSNESRREMGHCNHTAKPLIRHDRKCGASRTSPA